VIQLHGNVYHFAPGTRARLQLLPRDGDPHVSALSYVRPSNDQQDVTISNVEVRLPVREKPGSLNGMVVAPAPKVLPKGYELADDYKSTGSVAPDGTPKAAAKSTVKGTKLKLRLNCRGVNLCRKAKITIKGKKKPLKNVVIAKKTGISMTAGKTATVSFKLTRKARNAFKDRKKRKVVRRHGKKRVKQIKIKGLRKITAKVTVSGWDSPRTTKLTIKRNGKVK
jgi:hypothetical protein